MLGLLERNRQAIAEVCSRFHVERLEVFGSALRDELRTLLDREIDLVMVDAIKNRYVSREIERTKQLLYAA